jgi:integrase
VRARTGSLVLKPSGYFGRVWITRDGVTKREFVSLETKDRPVAKRKLTKLVAMLAAGDVVAVAKDKVEAPTTIGDWAKTWHARRVAAGVVMARDEWRNLSAYVLPVVGASMPLDAFTEAHADDVLESARRSGLAWETVKKIRGVLRRMFDRARREKLVTANPILDVELPEGLKKDKRPRVILTDEEITAYLSAPGCDLELKLLSFVARTMGGMRSSELRAWDWSMIDCEAFESATILRSKTHDVQRLELPAVLRPYLSAWNMSQGSPKSGAVFPVRRGVNKGLAKMARGTSFAHRLKRDLLRAGVTRLPTTTDAKGHTVAHPSDPIYFETPVSLPVDFHSFRRAFSTGLARAGLNLQRAMGLASHSDARTHLLYVSNLESARPIPADALPQIGASVAGLLAPAVPKGKRADSRKSLFSSAPGPIRTDDFRLGGLPDSAQVSDIEEESIVEHRSAERENPEFPS